MQKMVLNYKKIPNDILDRINDIDGNEILVGTVIKVSEKDFNNKKYSDLNISFVNGELSYNNRIIPSLNKGRFSKKNLKGYIEIFKNREKEDRVVYMGERPYFGDWTKGSFSLYRTFKSFPRINHGPKELMFQIDFIKEEVLNGEKFYIFKIIVLDYLNKEESNFNNNLLFNLNLLQENYGSSNIFNKESKSSDFLDTLIIDWEIFPLGERNDDLKKIIGKSKNITKKNIDDITKRYEFIRSLKPKKIISGKSGMRRYFGAQFSDNLVIFENRDYGNAIYVLFENWEYLSKLSRIEIQNRPDTEYIRIPHIGNWENKVKKIIFSKLRNITK